MHEYGDEANPLVLSSPLAARAMEHRNSTAFGVMGMGCVANNTITQRLPPTEQIGMPTAVASLTFEFSTRPSGTLLLAHTICPPSQTLRQICRIVFVVLVYSQPES